MPGSSPEDLNADVTEVETVPVDTEATAAPPAEASPDAKDPADSSTADPKGAKDLVATVKEALEAQETSPDSKTEGSQPAEGSEAAAKKDGADAESEADDLSEEDLSRLSTKTRKRIQHLVDKTKESQSLINDLEPRAKQFDQVVRFVENAGLTTQEVNDGFDIMAALKNDPLKAWEKLKPIVSQLRQLAGEDLPEDLNAQVNQGLLTREHASELARTRSTAAVSQQQLQRTQELHQAREQQAQVQERMARVSNAVATWESTKAGSDPAWKQKQPRVMELVELETLRRQQADPNFAWTPDEAVKFADAALTRINNELKQFVRPKAVTPVTDVASTRSVGKPRTALEAAKQGLAAAG